MSGYSSEETRETAELTSLYESGIWVHSQVISQVDVNAACVRGIGSRAVGTPRERRTCDTSNRTPWFRSFVVYQQRRDCASTRG